jgi:hypothetical protein
MYVQHKHKPATSTATAVKNPAKHMDSGQAKAKHQ